MKLSKKGGELQRNIFFSSQEQRLMAVTYEGIFVVNYMVIIANAVIPKVCRTRGNAQ